MRHDPEELKNLAAQSAHAARLLSPYKVPVRIDVRAEEFPRNASGKTLKPTLRAEMLARLAASGED